MCRRNGGARERGVGLLPRGTNPPAEVSASPAARGRLFRRRMKVLVTGAAGFIGYHVARRLAETKRCEVLGVDAIGDYYDPALKQARVAELGKLEKFRFLQADFADAEKFSGLMAHFKPQYVVHLGAQPGVRYSIDQPSAYTHSNLDGFAS